MLWYMYIDESGDLGLSKNSSKFLVITALLVKDPAYLDRIIKNMRRNKFKKQLKVFHELKANKLKDEIIIHALSHLSQIKDLQIYHIVLEKSKVHSKFLLTNKHKLYNYVAGKLAKTIILEHVDVEVRIDKSKGKQALQEDFNQYFENCLRQNSSVRKIKVFHSYSQSWSGLQFADLLCYAAYKKIELGITVFSDIVPNQEVFLCW
jgi:hypothetical protein